MPSLPTTPLRPHSPPRVRAGRAAPATISLAGLLTVSVCAARAQGQVPAPRRYTVVPLDVPGAVVTVAHGINAAGQVVGTYTDTLGRHGFVYAEGAFLPLDAPGARLGPRSGTSAHGVNAAGQVVGDYFDGAHMHGFVATPRR